MALPSLTATTAPTLNTTLSMPSAVTTNPSVGLGGVLKTGPAGATKGGADAGIADPLMGEVPKELMEELNKLKNHIKEMQTFRDSCKTSLAKQDSANLNEDIGRLRASIKFRRTELSEVAAVVSELLSMVRRENRLTAVISRGKEGRSQTVAMHECWEFLQQELTSLEHRILELDSKTQEIDRAIEQSIGDRPNDFSRKELQTHLERFDGIYNVISQEAHQLHDMTEDAKIQFLEYSRKVHGPYFPNPFDKRRAEERNQSLLGILGSMEPFPSATSVAQYQELISKIPQQNPQTTGLPGFGATTATTGFGSAAAKPGLGLFSAQPGSLFGAAKPATSFAPAASTASSAAGSLFKPFGSTTTTTASSGTTPSLFGNTLTTSTSTAGTTAAVAPIFGKTLTNSSGTLFAGPANKQAAT